MGSPYSSVSVSGYNNNPPPDDGSTAANNKMKWADVTAKIGNPLNTYAAAQDSAITTMVAKLLSGGSVASTGTNYTVTTADQGRTLVATASGITFTFPDATAVHNPFVFAVNNNSTGTITLAGTSSQTIDGSTSQVIRPGSGAIFQTDGSNWFTLNGLKQAQIQSTNPPYGFDAPINLRMNASVGSSKLTITFKTNSNNDPSTSDPILIPFRDSTLTAGDPVWRSVTSALSIDTNAAGATLGTQNNVPFRLWVVLFDNGGTVVPALWHSGAGASSIDINSLNETGTASATGISAAATSAGTFYCPNGTTITSKSFRIVGFVTYETALGTAGTYSAAPDVVQLFGPGVPRPGEVLQTQLSSTTSSTTFNTTSPAASNLTGTITPGSKANLVKAQAWGIGNCTGTTAAHTGLLRIYRNTGGTAIGNHAAVGSYASVSASSVAMFALDNPQVSSSMQYGVYGWVTNTTNTNLKFPAADDSVPSNQAILLLEEIMG